MSVLVCARSNWQWQVKQRIDGIDVAETKGIRTLRWQSQSKHQLLLVEGTGRFEFITFDFKYHSSLRSFNHKEQKNLAYVAFVVNRTLNLTPLRRFVMPPPLSEKQIQLDSFPVHLDMFGHDIAAICSDGTLVLSNCMAHETLTKLKLDLEVGNVMRLSLFKSRMTDQHLKVAIVSQNPDTEFTSDLLTIYEVKGDALVLIKSLTLS
mmetsp:Transcript_12010/g.20269  ORF Transcript_12010/g.20269 Transcript_12010/m.20269 type:complete len:207 (-) Transcript_12010:2707-3327(-)